MERHHKPQSHRLRRGRVSEPGRIYLVTTVTENRVPLFAEFIPARLVVSALRYEHESGAIQSLAWVLMPDHLHWLLQLQGRRSLGTVMQRFKSHSALAIRRNGSVQEKVWQVGYHDHALRRDEDIRKAARYIVANPLRAGLVERIEEYPFWDAIWL